MKKLLLILLITLSACFTPIKYQQHHPKRYEKIVDSFVADGKCSIKIIKTDTLIKDSLSIIDLSRIDTFTIQLPNGKDTEYYETIKYKDSINYKEKIVNNTIIDSSLVSLLKQQKNAMASKLDSKEHILNIYYILTTILVCLGIGFGVLKIIK